MISNLTKIRLKMSTWA